MIQSVKDQPKQICQGSTEVEQGLQLSPPSQRRLARPAPSEGCSVLPVRVPEMSPSRAAADHKF